MVNVFSVVVGWVYGSCDERDRCSMKPQWTIPDKHGKVKLLFVGKTWCLRCWSIRDIVRVMWISQLGDCHACRGCSFSFSVRVKPQLEGPHVRSSGDGNTSYRELQLHLHGYIGGNNGHTSTREPACVPSAVIYYGNMWWSCTISIYNKHTYIHVYIYICMYVYIYIYTFTHIRHIYIYIHIYIYTIWYIYTYHISLSASQPRRIPTTRWPWPARCAWRRCSRAVGWPVAGWPRPRSLGPWSVWIPSPHFFSAPPKRNHGLVGNFRINLGPFMG